jgi:hypothetical protein
VKLLYIIDGEDKLYLMAPASPEHHGFTGDRSLAERVDDDAVEGVAAWLHVPHAVHAEDADAPATLLAEAPAPVREAGVRPEPVADPTRHVRLTDDHPLDRSGLAHSRSDP